MSIRPCVTAFVSGCFDLLHAGHVKLLQTAANHCDILLVAVNRDDYCRRVKGPDRPRQPLLTRMEAVAQIAERLPCKTFIRVQMRDDPAALLSQTRPDVYVIGADHIGSPLIALGVCRRVVIVERLPGVSTTALVGSRETQSEPSH